MIFGFLFLGAALLNLEECCQDFVLETKRIEIPSHPYAFNSSMTKWRGGIVMSFRILTDPKDKFSSEIGLVWLDEQFAPLSQPQMLVLRTADAKSPCRAEDARLITLGDRLFMVYSDNIEPKVSRGGFRVHYGELEWDGEAFRLLFCERIEHFPGENSQIREKNWVPFEYNGELFLSYSISPHVVFFPYSGTNSCEKVSLSTGDIPWKWGVLRGGTPALREENEYLAFFHTSEEMASVQTQGKQALHYFMGAYTFASEPPFPITRISPEPIIGKNFYNGPTYKPYWKPIKAVFPCGFISDKYHIWISYGRDDHEIWIAKLDKQALLNSLIPVKK